MLGFLLSGRVIFVLSRFQVSLPGDVIVITFVVTYLSLNVTADCNCVCVSYQSPFLRYTYVLDERLIYFFVLENYVYISVILVDILRFSSAHDSNRFLAVSYFALPDFLVKYFSRVSNLPCYFSSLQNMEQGA